MNERQRDRHARAILRGFGLEVEAVGIHGGHYHPTLWEMAAVVVPNGYDQAYERALEVLTDPRMALVVTREHVGKYDTRIYVAFPAA
jgi:hypothetical protein